ncbi:hypothetical protein EDC04DRAFT_931349 [Pisolithus marmoratus]|nr:hypothetical protein EDC04DRAFT_931349 [Pisolithus marmoratus]
MQSETMTVPKIKMNDNDIYQQSGKADRENPRVMRTFKDRHGGGMSITQSVSPITDKESRSLPVPPPASQPISTISQLSCPSRQISQILARGKTTTSCVGRDPSLLLSGSLCAENCTAGTSLVVSVAGGQLCGCICYHGCRGTSDGSRTPENSSEVAGGYRCTVGRSKPCGASREAFSERKSTRTSYDVSVDGFPKHQPREVKLA